MAIIALKCPDITVNVVDLNAQRVKAFFPISLSVDGSVTDVSAAQEVNADSGITVSPSPSFTDVSARH